MPFGGDDFVKVRREVKIDTQPNFDQWRMRKLLGRYGGPETKT